MNYSKLIAKTYIHVTTPDNILKNNVGGFTYDASEVPGYDNKIHTGIKIQMKVSSYAAQGRVYQYSIPQLGTYFTHFKLADDAIYADFSVAGQPITKFGRLVPGMWYNFTNLPVNVHAIPYGQGFLNVTYYEDEGAGRLPIDIVYIQANSETLLKATALAKR